MKKLDVIQRQHEDDLMPWKWAPWEDQRNQGYLNDGKMIVWAEASLFIISYTENQQAQMLILKLP